MDREARDPFELCEELEHELGIDTYAVNWPIGCGKEFKGVYDRQNRKVNPFHLQHQRPGWPPPPRSSPTTPALADLIGADKREQLMGEIELLDGASCDFDLERVRHGKLSPVFFGSALTNFGVEPLPGGIFTHDHLPPAPEGGGRGHRLLRPGLLRLRL